MGVLLDDNNRKLIARLWFTAPTATSACSTKTETRLPHRGRRDIYRHADTLRATVVRHIAEGSVTAQPFGSFGSTIAPISSAISQLFCRPSVATTWMSTRDVEVTPIAMRQAPALGT